MKFKLWLKQLNEGEIFTAIGLGRFEKPGQTIKFNAYKNPSKEQIQKQLEETSTDSIRGLVDSNKNIYTWPEDPLNHEGMTNFLKVKMAVEFYISKKYIARLSDWSGLAMREQAKKLVTNPVFQSWQIPLENANDLLGRKDFEIGNYNELIKIEDLGDNIPHYNTDIFKSGEWVVLQSIGEVYEGNIFKNQDNLYINNKSKGKLSIKDNYILMPNGDKKEIIGAYNLFKKGERVRYSQEKNDLQTIVLGTIVASYPDGYSPVVHWDHNPPEEKNTVGWHQIKRVSSEEEKQLKTMLQSANIRPEETNQRQLNLKIGDKAVLVTKKGDFFGIIQRQPRTGLGLVTDNGEFKSVNLGYLQPIMVKGQKIRNKINKQIGEVLSDTPNGLFVQWETAPASIAKRDEIELIQTQKLSQTFKRTGPGKYWSPYGDHTTYQGNLIF